MGSLSSLFLQRAHGFSPKTTGLALSVIFLASAVSNPLFGWLLTPVRRALLRPVLDLAGRQSEVNALTARALSELANRAEELRAAQAERLKAEQAVRALRQRIASLESALADLRRSDLEGDERNRP